MSDGTTLVVTATPNPNETEAMQHYVKNASALLADAGGVPAKRLKLTEAFHGEASFTTVIVMDFPSKQKLIDVFKSDDYKAIVPYRDKGFSKIDIFFTENVG